MELGPYAILVVYVVHQMCGCLEQHTGDGVGLGMTAGTGLHTCLHPAQQGHCATACLGSGKGQVPTANTGPHRCPTQVGSAGQQARHWLTRCIGGRDSVHTVLHTVPAWDRVLLGRLVYSAAA